jgi:hypothetical protein
MAIYTVHVPRDPVDPREFVERCEVVPDGFSWGAFFLGPLWLLWNRLWFALALWIVAMALLWFGTARFSPVALLGLAFLVECLLGLEGNSILAAALRRRGLILTDIVTANRSDAAERIYFRRLARKRPAGSAAARPVASAASAERDEFVGLSPDSGG